MLVKLLTVGQTLRSAMFDLTQSTALLRFSPGKSGSWLEQGQAMEQLDLPVLPDLRGMKDQLVPQ